jgi:hypothetical protein
MTTFYFPHPTEHAIAMLDATLDNVHEAFQMAAKNADRLKANERAWDYWIAVAKNLMPEEDRQKWN